jgi:DNA repair protein RecN (Recombination protein N)
LLRELELASLGVITHARLTLPPGLTVVTGETGAGKTMLLGALAWLVGGRADSSLVAGDRAQVSGVFQVTSEHAASRAAEDAGAAVEDGELIAARTVTANGRSRAHLGGVAVPSAALAASVGQLVAVHGQSDQLRLKSTAEQRDLLDAFGGVDVTEFVQAHGAARAVLAQLAALESQDREAVWEADALRRSVREIETVSPELDEETALPARIERLANAEDLREAAALAAAALAGAEVGAGAGATADLDAARRALEAGAARDPALSELARRAGELAYLASDLGSEVAEYMQGLDSDPETMAQLQERRAALNVLLRKHGSTAAEVLEWAEAARRRLADLDFSPERREQLAAEADRLVAARSRAASALTAARTAAGVALADAVTAELKGLGMANARFEVAVEPAAEVGAAGADTVEFRFTGHGGAARPLARGASGGELSRVMLALEVATLGQDGGRDAVTLVFDEVDQGVGGAAALAVAERLARLATGRQVVAVTHLPQVAAAADHHVVVSKEGDGTATVQAVTGGARRSEVARMLAGVEDSAAARRHAAELLSRDWVGKSSVT